MLIIDEQTSISIEITCTDENGASITPSSFIYNLYNAEGNTKLLEETITPTDSIITVNISPTLNKIINDSNQHELLIFSYKWTYPVDKGESGTVLYKINRLNHI